MANDCNVEGLPIRRLNNDTPLVSRFLYYESVGVGSFENGPCKYFRRHEQKIVAYEQP